MAGFTVTLHHNTLSFIETVRIPVRLHGEQLIFSI